MMARSVQVCGALAGMLLALIAADVRSRLSAGPAQDGVILPECGTALREIVIHYVAGDTIALPVYRDMLPQLSADVRVHVVCPNRASFDEFVERIGIIACKLQPVVVGHEMTTWSRDRWAALSSSSLTTLLAPADEEASIVWPQRAGDAKIAFDLAHGLWESTAARRSSLYFDGGDFLAADGDAVFVTPAVLSRNIHRTVASRDELTSVLSRDLGKKAVLLDPAPPHHAGMFMMAVGDRTILVGDPSLAKSMYANDFPTLPGGPDFSAETQSLFDAVASQVAARGYRVVRIPTMCAPDGKTYLTYVNVITETRDAKKIVYMPIYQNAGPLNDAAAAIWRSLGYEIRPVDCTSCYQHFGTLHCLVNVLSRT